MEALSLPQGSQGRLPRGGKAEPEVLNDESTLQTKAWKGVVYLVQKHRVKETLSLGVLVVLVNW